VKKSTKPDIARFEEEYRGLAPMLPAFGDELERQLIKVVANAGVTLGFPIQKRVKTWESIAEKFSRTGLNLPSVAALQDLVGFRVILVFLPDLAKVAAAIEGTFSVVRQYDTTERLSADQFGYSSLHFVVRMPSAWAAVPTMSQFPNLAAEVQVRTVAQHIWAEASTRLQYKHESSVPRVLRRGICRVSALLETVDLEFASFLSDRDKYREEIGTPNREPTSLDSDILEKVLDLLLPASHKAKQEAYGLLLSDLRAMGIEATDKLRALVVKRLDEALKHDAEVVAGIQGDDKEYVSRYRGDPARVKGGVFFTHVGLVREILSKEFGSAWNDHVTKHLTEKPAG